MSPVSVAAKVARTVGTILLLAFAVGVGKMMQLGSVELFGDRIGFDAASAIGLGIFLLLAFALLRLARWYRANKKGRRI